MSTARSKQSSTVSFGLSFLDVLSCGLGAATLLLLIVKHGPATEAEENLDFIATRVTEVEAKLESLQETREELRMELGVTDELIERQIGARSASSQLEADRMAALAKLKDQLSDARKELASSQGRLQEAKESKSLASVIPDAPKVGREGSLIGLKIMPSHVVILLDRSASMLSSTLVEIIRLRASSNRLKIAAAKWVTARQAAEWAYLQIDDGREFQILSYSDTVTDLNGNSYPSESPIQWLRKNFENDYKTLMPQLRDIVPSGPTDLKTALEVVGKLDPVPKQIYLITDGYPTLAGKARLSSFRDCPRASQGVTPYLSPSCRLNMFMNAARVAERHLARTRFDTVMLPLEGDANAIQGYWMLSATSGGRLLTPAPGWPAL